VWYVANSPFYVIQHKKDLSDAVRRINPASVNTAPNVFWDVEGSLKTVVSYLKILIWKDQTDLFIFSPSSTILT
jgi:hypothetical protein